MSFNFGLFLKDLNMRLKVEASIRARIGCMYFISKILSFDLVMTEVYITVVVSA